MALLLIEDNIPLATTIMSRLKAEYFTVQHCILKDDILHYLQEFKYDLILLDILLPDWNGFDAISHIRSCQKETPILVISALSEVDYRVKGLDMGADDYLTKPFNTTELIARIKVLLRRNIYQTQNLLVFRDLTLDLNKHAVVRDGKAITLRAKEYQILQLLLRYQGRVFSRQQLLEQVWGSNAESESNTIDVHIRYLRKKIDEPFKIGYIKTIKGIGYVLK